MFRIVKKAVAFVLLFALVASFVVLTDDFRVEAAAKKTCSIKLKSSVLTYNGKKQYPQVVVKSPQGKTLKNKKDYTVSFSSGSKNIGKYSLAVKLKGAYSGSKTLTYQIIPKNVTKLKFTQITKRLKIHESQLQEEEEFTPIGFYSKYVYVDRETDDVKLSWKKVTGATGYKVYIYKNKKWQAEGKTGKTSYTVRDLKPGKTYHYAVRAYATVKGKTYYSADYEDVTVAIRPKTTTLRLKIKNKKAYISWDKQTCSGYSLRIDGENIDIKSSKTTSYVYLLLPYDSDINVEIYPYVKTSNGKILAKGLSGKSEKSANYTPFAKKTSGGIKLQAIKSKTAKSIFKKWLEDKIAYTTEESFARAKLCYFEGKSADGKRTLVYHVIDGKWEGVDTRGVCHNSKGKPKGCPGCEKYEGYVDSNVACDGWDCYKFLFPA